MFQKNSHGCAAWQLNLGTDPNFILVVIGYYFE